LTWRASFPSSLHIELPSLKVQKVFKGTYVLTGFRDARLQKRLDEAGWIQDERITKTTNLLIVSSIVQGSKESGKTKMARESGIRILPRDQVDILFQT